VSHRRLPGLARSGVIDILAWSADHFGNAARDRYREVLPAGVADIAAYPARPGSRLRPEIDPAMRPWRLRTSRELAGILRMRTARRFLIYRLDGDIVVIGRGLNDAMHLADNVEDEPLGSWRARDRCAWLDCGTKSDRHTSSTAAARPCCRGSVPPEA
jgi:toxin ParE1/3/4